MDVATADAVKKSPRDPRVWIAGLRFSPLSDPSRSPWGNFHRLFLTRQARTAQTMDTQQPNHAPYGRRGMNRMVAIAILCPKMLGEPLAGSSPHLQVVAKRFSEVFPTAIDMALIELFGYQAHYHGYDERAWHAYHVLIKILERPQEAVFRKTRHNGSARRRERCSNQWSRPPSHG